MRTQAVGSKKKVLTYKLLEPLCGVKSVRVEIDTASGNLAIDSLTGSEPVLASGTLEYVENQGMPVRSVNTKDGEATLTLKSTGIGRAWLHFPWSACNAATDWHIHLNPDVQADITARSGGGNVRLDLACMTVTRLSAETGGGNLEVVLPENTAGLSVTVRTGGGNVSVEIGHGTKGSSMLTATSGAGNVDVQIPSGLAARAYATSGWGKVILAPQFTRVDANTYQSADFDKAVDRVEIVAQSGAGNVHIHTR